MNSGQLRHRLLIERRGDGQDELGQPVDLWEEVATVWAAINDARGRQYVESNQATVNEVTSNVRIRYRTDIVPEMRASELCHARRVFDIVDVRYSQPPRPEVVLECRDVRVEEAVSS